jgi:hypothetical protein
MEEKEMKQGQSPEVPMNQERDLALVKTFRNGQMTVEEFIHQISVKYDECGGFVSTKVRK